MLKENYGYKACHDNSFNYKSLIPLYNSSDIFLFQHSLSFVRQHVSYPPTKRNRSQRIKASSPQHGYQDSYDSGIHTSDHEIFV